MKFDQFNDQVKFEILDSWRRRAAALVDPLGERSFVPALCCPSVTPPTAYDLPALRRRRPCLIFLVSFLSSCYDPVAKGASCAC